MLNDYTEEYTKEQKVNGALSEIKEVEQYNFAETSALGGILDGDQLTKEIGGKTLAGEIQDSEEGAGIKDKGDLQDLLSSIKGANVFMNKTPKDQL